METHIQFSQILLQSLRPVFSTGKAYSKPTETLSLCCSPDGGSLALLSFLQDDHLELSEPLDGDLMGNLS